MMPEVSSAMQTQGQKGAVKELTAMSIAVQAQKNSNVIIVTCSHQQ